MCNFSGLYQQHCFRLFSYHIMSTRGVCATKYLKYYLLEIYYTNQNANINICCIRSISRLWIRMLMTHLQMFYLQSRLHTFLGEIVRYLDVFCLLMLQNISCYVTNINLSLNDWSHWRTTCWNSPKRIYVYAKQNISNGKLVISL